MIQAGDSLVIATHNAGKLREISDILKDTFLNVMGADAFNLPEPEETGATFEANAILKAECGVALVPPTYWVMADDSGLEVDALGGDPGIYSARWGGEGKDFALAMQRVYDTLTQAGHTPEGQRSRFVCVLALARYGRETLTFRGTVEGRLTFPARGEKGFGYDPIFIVNGYDITFAEMDASAKHAISHRADAFAQLKNTVYDEGII